MEPYNKDIEKELFISSRQEQKYIIDVNVIDKWEFQNMDQKWITCTSNLGSKEENVEGKNVKDKKKG
jgi:hypothetical protein